MPTVYPIVPGHEMSAASQRSARRSRSTSPATSPPLAAWWTRTAPARQCQAGLEQFCPNHDFTYNLPDKHLGGVTYGGYSDSIVVDQRFVLRVPANLDLGAAPLLCAGITTYSPLRHWSRKPVATIWSWVGFGSRSPPIWSMTNWL